MSVVAVKVQKDKIVIGSDSIRTHGWTQEKDKEAKLWKIDDNTILGAVGSCDDAFLFKQFLETHRPKEPTEERIMDLWAEFTQWVKAVMQDGNYKVNSTSFFLVFNGKVFYINGFFIREVTDYYAIGAGMDYALAALYLGSSVEKSIETACELSIFCEQPINLMEVRRK